MEPRAHHVLIGLFTVIVGAGALLFALWLAGAGQGTSDRYYTVLFNEAVQGLSVGSSVQYNGIKVGEVVNLTLDHEDMRRVRARIKLPENLPIRTDTRARLVMTGITGSSVIGLSGGSPESPLLEGEKTMKDDEVDEPGDPILVAAPSPISQLLAGGDNLMNNLTELVVNAKRFFSAKNARHVSHMFENLDDLTEALSDQTGDLHQLMLTLQKSGSQLDATLQQVSKLVANADSLLGNQGRETLDAMRRAMSSLEHTSGSLESVVKNNASALGSGMQGLQEIGPALNQLRNTLATMETILQRMNDNPASYLLGGETYVEYTP